MEQLLAETVEAVARLAKANKALRTQNERLTKELARVSAGWVEIKKLARSAPRAPRSRRSR